ncbi:MAG TPA: hypothetical protein VIR00_10310 [Micromonosporaceae bacterium]|jgi:hypothetical protein
MGPLRRQDSRTANANRVQAAGVEAGLADPGAVEPHSGSDAEPDGGSDVDRPGRLGRPIRLIVAFVVAVLVLYGTVAGQDDLFPFGPFRMYATADKLNSPVADTHFEIIDTTGATIQLTEVNTGIRRAEIEGQLGRFQKDPSLLRIIDDAYVTLNPKAPSPVRVQIIIRWYALHDGTETGAYTTQTVATWTPPGVTK